MLFGFSCTEDFYDSACCSVEWLSNAPAGRSDRSRVRSFSVSSISYRTLGIGHLWWMHWTFTLFNIQQGREEEIVQEADGISNPLPSTWWNGLVREWTQRCGVTDWIWEGRVTSQFTERSCCAHRDTGSILAYVMGWYEISLEVIFAQLACQF